MADAHQLSFAGFDQWSSLFIKGGPELDDADALAWLVFGDDVFSLEEAERLARLSSPSRGQEISGLLSALLAPLTALLQREPTLTTIVGWAADRSLPAVESARGLTVWQEVSLALAEHLLALSQKHSNLLLLDLDQLFAGPGRENCFDDRVYYMSRCRLSMPGIKTCASALAALLERSAKAAHKVLVLDCDNTLWGGVVGEDGLAGLELGQDGQGKAFQDFQRVCRYLSSQGVVLALCSKNNQEDVWEVFDNHKGMILKREDIISHRINWQLKSSNIVEIAEELGLGLDSMVFWDDNPMERAQMSQAVPQVMVAEPSESVVHWPRELLSAGWFSRFELTNEDRKKSAQYRSRAQFQQERQGQLDEVQFLRSLELKPSLIAIDEGTIARAAQMSAKTNQFNLRVVRRDQAAIMDLCSSKRNLGFLGHLGDRFGDHGNVGLVLVRGTNNPDLGFLDTFLLSCRVLGRHFEAWMLQQCVEAMQARGFKWLLAEHREQPRNQMCSQFLEEHGFKPMQKWAAKEADMVKELDLGPEKPERLFLADLSSLTIPYTDLYPHE